MYVLNNFIFFPDKQKQVLSFNSQNIDEKKINTNKIKFNNQKHISFDSYFNSFFSDYYVPYINTSEIFLCFSFCGQAKITIYGHSEKQGKYRVHQEIIKTEQEKDLSYKILLTNDASRYWLEVEALIPETYIQNSFWGIDEQEVSPYHLAIVTCSFRREKEVENTIKTLKQSSILQSEKWDLWVIDNGQTLDVKKLSEDNIFITPQENTGGAGGFGRGMKEVHESGKYTHILLMDDDVEILEEAIFRIIQLQKIAPNNLAIGGAMFDLYRPQYLTQAGAFAHRRNALDVQAHHGNINLEKADLSQFEAATKVDHNGWWLMGFSVQAIKELGYALPIFIHEDDVEYGMRLSQNGYDVKTLPGAMIWHAPFYAKPQGWMPYFDMRNHLIVTTLRNHQQYNAKETTKIISKKVRDNLYRRDYGAAAVQILAIKDFLKGPDLLLKSTSQEILERVVQTYNQYNQISEIDYQQLEISPHPKPKGLAKLRRYITQNGHSYPFLHQGNHLDFIPSEEMNLFPWWMVPEKGEVKLVYPWIKKAFLYPKKTKNFQKLNQQKKKILRQFIYEWQDAQTMWKNAENILTQSTNK